MNLYPWEAIALFIQHRETWESDNILHFVGVFTSTRKLIKALRQLELEKRIMYLSQDKEDWFKKPFKEFGYRGIEDCFEGQISLAILTPDKVNNWWEAELEGCKGYGIDVVQNGHWRDGYGSNYNYNIEECDI